MDRRRFLLTSVAGAFAAPEAARAQQRATVPTVGFLVPATGPYIGAPTAVYEAFRQGLRDLGYVVEGRDISLEYRSSPDRAHLADLAAELVRLNVDLIVAAGVATYPASETRLERPGLKPLSYCQPRGGGEMNQPSAPGVFGTAGILSQPLPVTLGEGVGVALLLLLSLAVNAFQFHQRRVYIRTLYNELVAIFNSIGWLLVRCMSRTEELESRIKTPDKYVAESTILREFRNYSRETEFLLRVLHEQLVGMAKTLSVRGHLGYFPEEKERLEERYGAKLKRVD